jgi:aspartate aminotransferase, mitochondrial
MILISLFSEWQSDYIGFFFIDRTLLILLFVPPNMIRYLFFIFYFQQTDPRKVNICVGAYRDEKGLPWVLPSVRAAELKLLEENDNKEYIPIEGDPEFINKALLFAYGADADLSRIAGVQSLSGTGACRIGGHFLAKFFHKEKRNKPIIYIPTPTWGNHYKIFQECGLETRSYRYYSRATNGLDLQGMLDDLSGPETPDECIVLLHACAHNPTGCDPTPDQYEIIANTLAKKKHVVFMDSAYQGFASGDAELDASFLRYMVSRGDVPVLLAQSFAKNFGLYGERCGTLSVVCGDATQKERILSQLRLIIRPMYSSPPRHGSSIVKTVLSDPKLTAQYYDECATMATRIQHMRHELVDKLKQVGSQHDWSHVLKQIGMFAFTGMSEEMCDQLTSEYAIYLTRDGRISLAGLNEQNIEYVAKAIHAVTEGKSITTAPSPQ